MEIAVVCYTHYILYVCNIFLRLSIFGLGADAIRAHFSNLIFQQMSQSRDDS